MNVQICHENEFDRVGPWDRELLLSENGFLPRVGEVIWVRDHYRTVKRIQWLTHREGFFTQVNILVDGPAKEFRRS